MIYESLYEEYGFPIKGNKLIELKSFLIQANLEYEESIEFTVILRNGKGEIVATGSLDSNVIKCIAVLDSYKEEGLTAKIVTILTSQAISSGKKHLFLFTTPENTFKFKELGFYTIIKTNDVALMENKKNGILEFVNSLKSSINCNFSNNVGAIVLNCNPFTKGHLYLIETAAKKSSLVHLFVVSEDKSIFPSNVRYDLVKSGVSHLDNVVVHPTSDYLISHVTFPTYFIKDNYKAGEINCKLDLCIFSEYFAKILNIKKRFVGSEPYDSVTAAYNEQMKKILGRQGIEVIEIPRCEYDGNPISASQVRKFIALRDYEQIRNVVPSVTYAFIISEKGMDITERLRNMN